MLVLFVIVKINILMIVGFFSLKSFENCYDMCVERVKLYGPIGEILDMLTKIIIKYCVKAQ